MTDRDAAALDAALDRWPLSGLQLTVFAVCALVGVLDGYDTQVMAVGAGSVARSLGLTPAMMSYAIVAGLAGAAVGAVTVGQLSDHVGRRLTLAGAALLFGLMNCATPFVQNLPQLVGLRFAAGLGLGGAAPVFVALASGYAPARLRGAIASLVWSSFPLGITIGGLTNGMMLRAGRWQDIFFVGGAGGIVVALLAAWLLPESIEFLAAKVGRQSGQASRRLARVLARLGPGVTVNLEGGARPRQGLSPGVLFRDGRRTSTLLLWAMLFCCFGTTAVAINYVPLVMHQSGVSAADAAFAVSWHGLGALAGMLVAGRLVDKFGPAAGLAPPLLLGAAAAGMLGHDPAATGATSVFFAAVGGLVGLGASGAIAVSAILYPATARATGTGWGIGLGRLGQVALPAAFGLILVQAWSVRTGFVCLALMPLLAALCAILLGRQMPLLDSKQSRTHISFPERSVPGSPANHQ